MNFEIAPKSTEIQTNWDDAKMYCFSLIIDGKTGWRLPTREELNEILHSENDFEEWHYWYAIKSDGCYAWIQFLDNGFKPKDGFKQYGDGYVRAVRTI